MWVHLFISCVCVGIGGSIALFVPRQTELNRRETDREKAKKASVLWAGLAFSLFLRPPEVVEVD